MSFFNPIKACFFNEKYSFTIQTRITQIVNSIFLIKTSFLKIIIGVQNQLHISFGSDLVCNKIFRDINSTHTQTQISNL